MKRENETDNCTLSSYESPHIEVVEIEIEGVLAMSDAKPGGGIGGF